MPLILNPLGYSYSEWLLFIALNVKATFSVFFNIFIIYVIWKRKSNSVTFVLIANQAACDAICCVVYPLTWTSCSAYFSRQGRLEMSFCEVFTSIKMSSFTISLYTMVAIALERYVKLYYPLNRTNINAKLSVAITWTLGIAVTMVQMQNLRIGQFFTERRLTGCMFAFAESSRFWFFKEHYNYILTVVLGGLVPLMVAIWAYAKVILRLRERQLTVQQKSDIRSQEMERMKRKTIKMLVIMLIAYVLLTLPNVLLTIVDYFVVDLMNGCSPSSRKPQYFQFFYYMAQVSTCANVFILCWYNKSFREELSTMGMSFAGLFVCRKTTKSKKDYESINDGTASDSFSNVTSL